MNPDQLAKQLAPLIERVRTDVTATRTDAGHMIWTKEALTETRLRQHLGDGRPRGVCPIRAGESTTRVAVFDLDSHRGETPWPEMLATTEALVDALERHGARPTVFRSSGGRGVHVILLWEYDQDAYSVRATLTDVLAGLGFKNGAKGVSRGEIEIFPKQDAVEPEGFGNQFILPLHNKSALLEPLLGYEDAPRGTPIEWRFSRPVATRERPVRESRAAVIPEDMDAELKRLRTALAAIPNDEVGDLDYDEWRNIVFGISDATDGSPEGYELAYEFSARHPLFDERELEKKVWSCATPGKAGGITAATVYARARTAGWNDVSADDFEIIEPPADEAEAPGLRVLDPKDPMGLARAVLRGAHTSKGRSVLLRAGGLWYEHGGACWLETPEEAVRQGVWSFLDSAKKEVSVKVDEEGEDGKKRKKTTTRIEPFCPQQTQVTSTTDALKAVVGVKGACAPCWLPGYEGPEPRELVSLEDGLLHIPSRSLMPHTPGFFSVNALPYGWGDDQVPREWLAFLEAVWPGDTQAQDAVQEMFGYLLTADTSQQKMFLIQGPKRSGKGTIARVLGALLGRENMVSPTLTSLTSNFGLQPLIDKLVAMIPDARVGPQTNTQAVVEKLLMLSGEDSITVDRKNKDAWTGRLSARVVIMTNEVPQLGDASGALAGRFVTIAMNQSFYGREDLGLTDRLLKELPGIFRWALDGRDRLKRRGHFVQPDSAAETAADLFESSSPISAFVDEVMERGAEYAVPVGEAYDAWCAWCTENGRSHPGAVQTFSKMLKAAATGVNVWRPREGEARKREFTTIRIKPQVRDQLGLFPD